jgi:hypothetical protein
MCWARADVIRNSFSVWMKSFYGDGRPLRYQRGVGVLQDPEDLSALSAQLTKITVEAALWLCVVLAKHERVDANPMVLTR